MREGKFIYVPGVIIYYKVVKEILIGNIYRNKLYLKRKKSGNYHMIDSKLLYDYTQGEIRVLAKSYYKNKI